MPRSGTTLLAEQLSRALEVHIGPETHLLSVAGRHGSLPWRITRADAEQLVRRLVDGGNVHIGRHHLDRALEQHASGDDPLDLLDLMFAIAGTGASPDELVGEKTPRHLVHAADALEHDPNLAVVVIVRDPRDVHRSLGLVPWSTSNPVANALRWNWYARLTAELVELAPERVAVVRFEDLLDDPTATVADLAELLGATPRPPDAARGDGPGRSFDVAHEPWKRGADDDVDPGRRQAWRAEPTRTDRLIEWSCAAGLRRFGYDTSTPTFVSSALTGAFTRVRRLRDRWRHRRSRRARVEGSPTSDHRT